VTAFPSLGFDPAPGDAGEIARLGRETGRVAADVDALADEVRAFSELGSAWCGDAAGAFSASVGELPRQLRLTSEAFGAAARQLDTWSATLAQLQTEARDAEREAAAALARLREARAAAAALPPTNAGSDAFLAHLQAGPARARAVDAAEAALAAARRRGEAVRQRAQAGARTAERVVREAARVAPPTPGLLTRIGTSLVDGVQAANEAVGQWVRDNREVIAAVTDVLSTVAFVAAFVPGLGTPVLLASLAVLAGTSLLAAYTDERDAGDVLLAAAGFGLAGAATAAGRAAQVTRLGEAAAASGTRAPTFFSRGVGQPPSMFTNGLTMSSRELVWRSVQLQPTLAGHGVGLVSTVGTARDRGLLPPQHRERPAPAAAPARPVVHTVAPGVRAEPRQVGPVPVLSSRTGGGR